jgi:Flp pilus assembly protein TadG
MATTSKSANSNLTGQNRKLTRSASSTGQAIVIVALSMVALLSFVGLAIDGGRYYAQRRSAQNAADMASLAGINAYATNSTNSEAVLLAEINRIAELNGIADSDSTRGNAVNARVQAWFVDNSGTHLDSIDNDTADTSAPSGTTGIKVRAEIPYNTFIAGLFGQPTLRAEAVSIGRLSISTRTFTDNTNAAYVGGAECNDINSAPAHHYYNTNSAKFKGTIFVAGALSVGAVNSAMFEADFTVVGNIGTSNKLGDPYTAYTWNGTQKGPFENSNKFEDENKNPTYFYQNPSAPTDWPDWTQVEVSPGVYERLTAKHFRPVSPVGWYYTQFQKMKPISLPNRPDFDIHYVLGDTLAGTPGNANGTTAAEAITVLWQAGKKGIVYVDGHLTIPNGTAKWDGLTLVIDGRFKNLDGSRDFWTAGKYANGTTNATEQMLGMNITVLAGADLGGTARCAASATNWVFYVDSNANNTQYKGIVYVPYGQIAFIGNTSGGKDFSEALVTNSLFMDGNSWQLRFAPNPFVRPEFTTELAGN